MIYPMFAMFMLVPITAVFLMRARFRAVRSKELSIKYFRSMSGEGTVPDYAALPARHFTNLFELPLVFFVACIMSILLQLNGPVLVSLAWAFVFCRYAQALIHLTYNNVLHRMYAFGTGLIVVTIMWILLVVWAT